MRRSICTTFLPLLVILCSFVVFVPFVIAGPTGSPFPVNNYTDGTQSIVDAASGANGDKIILWVDLARGSANFIQRYNSDGQALQTDEWYIGYGFTRVAMDRGGNFIVVKTASDGSSDGVYATVYNRNGSVRIPEFRVNSNTYGRQTGGVVAMNAYGEFAIAWSDYASGNTVVYAKRFAADGAVVAPDAAISNSSYAIQSAMDIGIDKWGEYAVTWYSQIPASNQLDIWCRRFSPGGSALGSQTRVNTYTSGPQAGNRIAMRPRGDFVIVWESYGQDGDDMGIYAQLYDENGYRVGGEFRVNNTTVGSQQFSDVAMSDDGSFIVSWINDNRINVPSSIPNVYARQYWPTGAPYDDEFLVNTVPDSKSAFFSKIAMDLAGSCIVGWSHFNILTNNQDIYGQRFVLDTLPTVTSLINNQIVSGLTDGAGDWQYFKISVPEGYDTISISMYGGTGDGDLYVRYAALPTHDDYDASPYLNGNNESVNITNIPAGDWYIGINGYLPYSGVTLVVSYY